MKSSSKTTNLILIVIAALLIVAAIVVGCTVLRPALTPTEPVPMATETLPPPPVVDATWERVKAANKLVVGTSADYPPFEYYNPQFQLDGFDIMLIRAIGTQLGLQVEIQDFAFENLASALQVGQIDVAIAALSVTEERRQYADFSNVYYVAEEGILANQSSPIDSITSADQVVSQRVGVQNKSVYQAWFQKNQVDTGKMLASNLLVYPRMDSAINELKAGRVDLVVLDKPAADQYLLTGGLKLVESGRFQQLYAIAAVKGSSTLVSELNRALVELNNLGTINQLAQQYLGLPPDAELPTPAPTPTPPPNVPTATTAPKPACTDIMDFVKDLNYPDNGMKNPPVMSPGQYFKKGWRIKNIGTCTWTSSYYLGYFKGNVSGARMSGQPTAIVGSVPPGATYDMYVDLWAPLQPGVYQGFWQMYNAKNVPFVESIWVGIQVVSGPTVTPVITQTPSPNMVFKSDKTVINAGEAVTFSWTVQGAKEVYFYAQGESLDGKLVQAQASRTVYPPQTTIYELKAVYKDGTNETQPIRIEVVQPAPEAPDIRVFKAYPKQVGYGGTVTIEWLVEGDVDKVTIFKNNVPLLDDTSMNGSTTDNPTEVGWAVYAITVWWPGGDPISWQEDVQVLEPEPEPPTVTPEQPTPAPPAVIEYFTAAPPQIQSGGCIDLSWKVSGGVVQVQLFRGDLPVPTDGSFTGNGQDCQAPEGQVVYTLQALNADAVPQSAQAIVEVLPAPPEVSLAGTSWKLSSLYGASVLDGSTITAVFQPGNVLSGSGGCNDYNASYQEGNNAILIQGVASTQMACGEPAGVMEQEAQYFQLLQMAANYKINGNKLILYDNSGSKMLVYSSA